MKFTLKREGAIALSYPLIYWYAAFSTIWGITSILKLALSPKTLKNTFKSATSNAHGAHSFNTSTLIILAIIFFAIIYLAGLAINYYLIIGHSRRWIKGWFIIFTIGSVINLGALTAHFDAYALLFNGVSTILTGTILWQLFFNEERLSKPVTTRPDKPEITINYKPEKQLKSVELRTTASPKKHRKSNSSKAKAKTKKK